MLSKEKFIEQWNDELSGLLLSCFSMVSETTDPSNFVPAKHGRFMVNTIRKVQGLLARMHEDIGEENHIDKLADLVIAKLSKEKPEVKEAIKAKFRAAFTTEVKK